MAKFKGFIKTCVICADDFKVSPSREKAICCSRKCKDAWWSGQKLKTVALVCKGCGDKFFDYESHVSRRVYCSRGCHAKYRIRPDMNGDKNPNCFVGKTLHANGYVYMYSPLHPLMSGGSYVFEQGLLWKNGF